MVKKKCKKGVIAVAFGVGLLLACVCPSEWLVGILAALLIIMGLTCLK